MQGLLDALWRRAAGTDVARPVFEGSPALPALASAARVVSGAVSEEPLGYEQARDELAEVVRRLEAGGLTLEESLSLWERGEHLADVCEAWLAGAREKLDAALRRRETSADSAAD